MSFRFRSASGPALFTKMCGPTSAKVPKQIQNKKGYKPVGIFIMANAANTKVSDGWPSQTVRIYSPRGGPAIRSTVWFDVLQSVQRE
jgi:hypothetical protein